MTHTKPILVDVATANREVRHWLRDVANVRAHGTTKEQPVVRWQYERAMLLPLPPRYSGARLDAEIPANSIVVPMPMESLQHPLSRYHDLALEVAP